MAVVTLYGIKNCDTVKKARKWLDNHSVSYTFHDFRVDGINKTLINDFLKNIDREILINKRGTSWRKLSNKEKETTKKTELVELILNNPTIIKRPVLKKGSKYHVGFNDELSKIRSRVKLIFGSRVKIRPRSVHMHNYTQQDVYGRGLWAGPALPKFLGVEYVGVVRFWSGQNLA